MNIIKLKGGLGNQMFQFAFAKAIEVSSNNVAKFDMSFFDLQSRGWTKRDLELTNIFGINLEIATMPEIRKFKKMFFIMLGREFYLNKYINLGVNKQIYIEDNIQYNKNLLALKDTYFDGYFQSYKYLSNIEDEIRKVFTFPEIEGGKNKEVLQKIKNSNSVSIHVRCGDYMNHPVLGGITTLDYYKNAMAKMQELVKNSAFFLFSDDPQWVKDNLNIEGEHHIINWNSSTESFRDMQLMSLCKHNIIANSSFSWWAAWLNNNEGKKVICPNKWTNDDSVKIDDLILPSWQQIT